MRRVPLVARLAALIESGEVTPPEPRDAFAARLASHVAAESRAPGDYASREELLALFDGSPLAVVDVVEVGRNVLVGGKPARRRRVLALLARAG